MYKFNDLKDKDELMQLIKDYSSEYILCKNYDISKLNVVTRNNLPVALIELNSENQSIDYFEVFEAHRRKGYGREIINCLKSALYTSVQTIYVTPSNVGAKQFWEKCEFIELPNSSMLFYKF